MARLGHSVTGQDRSSYLVMVTKHRRPDSSHACFALTNDPWRKPGSS
jgi:hypothetical protein